MLAVSITLIYILLSIAVGVISGRGGNKNTREFFVSQGNLPFTMLIPLLFGELVAGAGTVGNAAGAYTEGVSAVWGVWGQALGCVIFVVFASRFFYQAGQKGAISVAEAFESRFDKKVRTAVSLVVLMAFTIVYAMQPAAIVGILEPLLGVSRWGLMVGCTALFVFLALFGLKGIARMNIVHSILIFSVMAVIGAGTLQSAGGLENVVNTVDASCFRLFLPDFKTASGEILGAAFAMVSAATVVNSCYSARSLRDARKGIGSVALIIMIFALFPVIIGISAKVVFPDANANSIIYIAAEQLSPVLSTLAAVAICASVLSTAPALLLTLSATVTRDIFGLIKPEADDREQMIFSRVSIVVIAFGAMFLSMNMQSILKEWLASFQIRAIVGIVLIISIYWKRVTASAAFWAILVGGLLATVWHYTGNPLGWQPFWVSCVSGVGILCGATILSPHASE